jgi:hypothetical protein
VKKTNKKQNIKKNKENESTKKTIYEKKTEPEQKGRGDRTRKKEKKKQDT